MGGCLQQYSPLPSPFYCATFRFHFLTRMAVVMCKQGQDDLISNTLWEYAEFLIWDAKEFQAPAVPAACRLNSSNFWEYWSGNCYFRMYLNWNFWNSNLPRFVNGESILDLTMLHFPPKWDTTKKSSNDYHLSKSYPVLRTAILDLFHNSKTSEQKVTKYWSCHAFVKRNLLV